MTAFIISILAGLILSYSIYKWIRGESVFNFNFNTQKAKDLILMRRGSNDRTTSSKTIGDDVFREQRKNSQEELDRILDKISKKGAKSLSKSEKEFLDKWQN